MDEILTCKHPDCNMYLKEPVMLPCGNNVCKSHVDENPKSEPFKCSYCTSKHNIPPNGFTPNNSLNQILCNNLHLNAKQKTCSGYIEEMDKTVGLFGEVIKDPEVFIYDTVLKLTNSIDLNREIIINNTNIQHERMINQLKCFEVKLFYIIGCRTINLYILI